VTLTVEDFWRERLLAVGTSQLGICVPFGIDLSYQTVGMTSPLTLAALYTLRKRKLNFAQREEIFFSYLHCYYSLTKRASFERFWIFLAQLWFQFGQRSWAQHYSSFLILSSNRLIKDGMAHRSTNFKDIHRGRRISEKRISSNILQLRFGLFLTEC
jgi:hypothetical protein